jgi:Neurotransmitter-gated ion-channel ligand binding domain
VLDKETLKANQEFLFIPAFTLRSLNSFDELSMSFKASFRLKLFWYDWRLTYKNLNSFGNNIAMKDSIWIPNLIFTTCVNDYYVSNDEMSALTIEKSGLAFLVPSLG